MRTQHRRETKAETLREQFPLERQPSVEASPNGAAHDFATLSIFPPNQVIQRQSSNAQAQDALACSAVPDLIQNPGNGLPLSEAARAQFETAMNTDFSDVRLFAGQNHLAPNALAFTSGSNVYTKSGFDPSQPSDRAILGHELTHVIQQRSGRVQGSDQPSIDPDAALESEADQLGTRAAKGEAVQISGANHASQPRAGAVVQRLSASVSFDVDAMDSANSTIKTASMERGEGTAGGDHSTSFSVFLDAATNAVLGKTFTDAVAAIMALVDDVEKLPNYYISKLANASSVSQVDQKILDIRNNANYSNPNGVHDLNKGSVLQKLMVDYVNMRNKLPNTLIKNDSEHAGNLTERQGLEAMQSVHDEFEEDANADNTSGRLTKLFAKGMLATFDLGALVLPLTAMTIPSTGTALGNHILTTLKAYPALPTDLYPNVIKYFLTISNTAIGATTPKKKSDLKDAVSIATKIDL